MSKRFALLVLSVAFVLLTLAPAALSTFNSPLLDRTQYLPALICDNCIRPTLSGPTNTPTITLTPTTTNTPTLTPTQPVRPTPTVPPTKEQTPTNTPLPTKNSPTS